MSKQFSLSQNVGAAARYIFNPNPSEYIPPGFPTFNSLPVIEGQDVRQYPYNEQQVWEFRWASAPQTTYTNLDNFAVRNASDDLPISYFFDGDFGNFPARYFNGGGVADTGSALVSGTKVRVLDVIGKPIPGLFDITFSRRATYVDTTNGGPPAGDATDLRSPLSLIEDPPVFTPRYEITLRLVKVDTV